ncbi:energy-coupling factor transporter transmembrane component T [Bacillus sp. BP-3]|uniref:energy-coupling factor transporter transmembrane component T n=1 Tax=Bacillus sp. BP-3 TaxID=3022773 RepID=UPI00232CAC39|nr:energy-coupling factor transporter transmembrane component T [Bacillus sp. BP-3]MDC2864123.1 energy-coupling factor transporter transmembrane component T [Bacillus sp. BP-3]
MKLAFSSMHPFINFLYYIGVIILCMVCLHPVFLIGAICMILILNITQGNGEKLRKMLPSSLFFAFIITIANSLLTHRGSTILFYIGFNPITLEAVIYGCTMALSLIVIMFTFTSYNEMISSHKFLYLFSRISPKAALLTMITVRFVPLFMRRVTHITLVQKTKGVQVDAGSLKERAQNGMKLLQVLLVCSLEEALQTADSMQARGFGVTKRSTYIGYRMGRRDWFILSLFVILFVCCLFCVSKEYGILTIYPKVEALFLDRNDLFVFIPFLMYISLPILMEGREWLWWRMQK